MKTQKRTSSPKKTKKVVGEVVEGVLSQAPPEIQTPPKVKPPKAIKPKKETNDDKYALKVTVDISEIEALSDKIKELEKSLSREKLQVEFLKWQNKDRLDALEVLNNNPWYKLLWMRFKGLI